MCRQTPAFSPLPSDSICPESVPSRIQVLLVVLLMGGDAATEPDENDDLLTRRRDDESKTKMNIFQKGPPPPRLFHLDETLGLRGIGQVGKPKGLTRSYELKGKNKLV
jgi:hypothetical protein